jgi:hypothetical protein
LFYVTLAEFGRIGIEYWVLAAASKANKRPSAAFVNPSKPIILTIHGQNHGELPNTLIKRHAELPYLLNRLVFHVDCNSLTPEAKRALFVSNREDTRRGVVHTLIQDEIIRVLKSDDDLTRLNNEARELGQREQDETATQEMRKEVARLLRMQGVNIADALGGGMIGGQGTPQPPVNPRPPRPKPKPLELHEPPTYIRLVWLDDKDITLHPQQRRYVRVETDANSTYHNPQDPSTSRLNIIVSGDGFLLRGSTPLEGGRMRVILEGAATAPLGNAGTVRVELSRAGLPVLSDERPLRIVETPPARPANQQLTLPPFETIPVEGPEDDKWATLDWPDDINSVASSALSEQGKLLIYYSTAFPKFATQLSTFERRNPAVALSFTKRYEIWLAVHSLLLHQEERERALRPVEADSDPNTDELREREERCRVATLSTLFAAREVQLPAPSEEE